MSRSAFYTGTGDQGDTTRLGDSARIPKDSALIEAVGTIDEAMTTIGMARAFCQSEHLRKTLREVQRHIYRLMAHLSAVSNARRTYTGLTAREVSWLEDRISELEAELPPLKDFVLPGESKASAACHLARTVVRRAERKLVAFANLESDLGKANLAYLNRLSSLMFIAALYEDITSGQDIQLARDID